MLSKLNNLNSPLWVVGETSYDYNDEYYSTPECGGMTPYRYFPNEAAAREYVLEKNKHIAINDNWWFYLWDSNFDRRWQWYCEQYDHSPIHEPYDVDIQTFPVQELLNWCQQNFADPLYYLPEVYTYQTVIPGGVF